MTEEVRLQRIDKSLASLERLAADQGAFNDRLIERLDRGAAAGFGRLDRQLDELERQGERLDRQGERLDRQLDELERQGAERERRAGERRAESKMEREALLRILERLDDIDPGTSPSSN